MQHALTAGQQEKYVMLHAQPWARQAGKLGG